MRDTKYITSVKNFMRSHHTLVKYIYDGDQKIGVVTAAKIDGEIRIGFSLCRVPLDSFDRYYGLFKAICRMKTTKPLKIGSKIEPYVEEMMGRAVKYFRIMVSLFVWVFILHFVAKSFNV